MGPPGRVEKGFQKAAKKREKPKKSGKRLKNRGKPGA